MGRCIAVGLSISAALVALAVACAEPIKPDPDKPRYECRRAEGIKVDGSLNDWDEAQFTEPFVYPWPAQTGPRLETRAALAWDDCFLYVAYRCEDPDITATHTERDDPTYMDDCVEIFIAAAPERSRMYFGFEMNALGTMYDYFNAIPDVLLNEWDAAGWSLRTRIEGTVNDREDTDRGWTLEVAIPLANFSGLSRKPRPEPGDVWRIILNRWDGTAPDRALSEWTPSGQKNPDPHRPEGFGELLFVGK
ncbi:MAG: carbohydrate-binding family 9-like protein [Armatimonadetes bacterium]|nr:carbohydrate-binding family 9-like protein [Armatimonadota bacterium]